MNPHQKPDKAQNQDVTACGAKIGSEEIKRMKMSEQPIHEMRNSEVPTLRQLTSRKIEICHHKKGARDQEDKAGNVAVVLGQDSASDGIGVTALFPENW
jgi:hypothetical protein